ncbi:uncharacterized protein LOC143577691 [Bidens hawaiensis]|uniref:uncharacterized protein LOC143577691 n=1 Tax=Bidens hawaiensis TaxID=980011 RepID=UPI00404A62EB
MAAVCQRTAKKAPKLASVISKSETKPINPTAVNESFTLPRLSDSKWWLHLQSDCMYQRGLTSVQVNPLENRDDGRINTVSSHSLKESCEFDTKWWVQVQPDCMYQRGLTGEKVNPLESRNPSKFVENQVNSSIDIISSLSSKESYEFVKMDSGGETDGLGSFVSKKSCVLVESCDLYRPLEPQKVKCGQSPVSRGGTQNYESKGKLLEALCHSQTRTRQAEVAVKKAYEEKEDAIKLLLRQEAQLFEYRQWIYVLQIENLCYQMKKNKNKSDLIPPVGAFSSSKFGKLDKNLKTVVPKKGKRIRTEHGIGRYERGLGKYAVVFVVGLGIVGAGLVLGWTIGWMLI